MLLSSILLKTIWDQRKTFLWWAAGVSALNALNVFLYPSVADVPDLDAIFESMPEAISRLFLGNIESLTSPEGYLNGQNFVVMQPLIFLVFAIGRGSGAIAGEEERGTLDLLLAYPIRRSRVVLEKFAAMVAATLALGVVSWLSMTIPALAVDMDISLLRLAEIHISCVLLGLVFGTVALGLGCATGSRGMSLGVASALAVAAYFVNALAPLVESLESAQKLSPFYLYIGADPLSNGLDPAHAGALLGIVAVFIALGLALFERRDLN